LDSGRILKPSCPTPYDHRWTVRPNWRIVVGPASRLASWQCVECGWWRVICAKCMGLDMTKGGDPCRRCNGGYIITDEQRRIHDPLMVGWTVTG
jgi:hypothetical protein